jgi:two-component system, cell cycle sensor histidine kinase and response regulator CckA
VYFDPFQLDQIMANLAVNARDAIGDSGTFSIATACAVLDENFCRTHPGATPGGYVRLTVGDSGRGIDPLLLPQLFEPFFTTKAECLGSGLGLSVVYGIIKQNGGYIDVASAIGQGTVFDIYFPKCAAEEPPPLTETADPSVLSREKTILLVEDEPLLMNMVLLMLNKAGYRVLAANSPEKALRLADEYDGEIDLLMTDVMMPGMNGHELAQKLISHLPKLKLLFMSGYPADLLGRQAIFADQACYIQKPFTLQECAGKIKEAIGQL